MTYIVSIYMRCLAWEYPWGIFPVSRMFSPYLPRKILKMPPVNSREPGEAYKWLRDSTFEGNDRRLRGKGRTEKS